MYIALVGIKKLKGVPVGKYLLGKSFTLDVPV